MLNRVHYTEVNFKYSKLIRESMKYLTYCDNHTSAGLNHQLSNIKTLIREAYALGRVPILPMLKLSSMHNCGREIYTDLSSYIDWKNSHVIYDCGRKEPLRYKKGNSLLYYFPQSSCKVSDLEHSWSENENDKYDLLIKKVSEIQSRKYTGLWQRGRLHPNHERVQSIILLLWQINAPTTQHKQSLDV